ncbi:hypothetical protein KR038_006285, partial [Drosophila bunnanda]
MLGNRTDVFAEPNEALPYNTNIVGTIRTENEDPIYSKLYPYPMGVSDFVNTETQAMLRDGIIRPSRSPYNNPVWVVDKKGTDERGNTKKRLVIDFRKLNLKTINDKYPIPNVVFILANLGKAKYFTTLDLKSGFHQIPLAESDREKTIIIEESGTASVRTVIMFGEKTRHLLYFSDRETLIQRVCDVVKKDVVNTILCELAVLAFIQHKLIETFPTTTFRYT